MAHLLPTLHELVSSTHEPQDGAQEFVVTLPDGSESHCYLTAKQERDVGGWLFALYMAGLHSKMVPVQLPLEYRVCQWAREHLKHEPGAMVAFTDVHARWLETGSDPTLTNEPLAGMLRRLWRMEHLRRKNGRLWKDWKLT